MSHSGTLGQRPQRALVGASRSELWCSAARSVGIGRYSIVTEVDEGFAFWEAVANSGEPRNKPRGGLRYRGQVGSGLARSSTSVGLEFHHWKEQPSWPHLQAAYFRQ